MSESAKPRMAVIGLGSMGFGMATSLRGKGYEGAGCDVAPDSVARFVGDGGKGASTPAEAAKGADIVISVVLNAAQTETILFGKDGVAETLAKDAVFISSATMDPDVARRLAKELEATGQHYLDAPISGGAQRGRLRNRMRQADWPAGTLRRALCTQVHCYVVSPIINRC